MSDDVNPARDDMSSTGSGGYWNPMQEYLLNARNIGQDVEKHEVDKSESTSTQIAEVNNQPKLGQDSSDVKMPTKSEQTKSNPDIHTKPKVVGKSKTRDLSEAPDPLRDNYTSDRSKTHIVEEPKSIPGEPLPPEKAPTLESVATSFLGRIDKIEDENEQLLDDNQRLIDSLRRMDGDSVRINERIKFAEDKFQKAMTENNLLKSEKNDLISQIQNSKADNDKLRKAAHDSNILLKVQTKEYEADKDQWDQKLEDAYSLVRSLESQVETLTEINQQLEHKISGLESNTSATTTGFETKLITLESQNEQLQETNAQLKVDLEECEGENEKLLKKLERLRQQNENFTSLQSEQESSADELQMALRSKEELCETLEQETLSLTNNLEQYQSKIDQLQDTLVDQEAKLQEQFVELRALEKDRESLEDKLIEKESESCTKCDNYQTEIRRLGRKNADQKEWLDTMRLSGASVTELSKQKQDYIEELQKEVIDLRIQNTTLMNEISKLRGASSTKDVQDVQMEEIKSSYKRVMEENRRLKSINAQHNMEETNTKSKKKKVPTATLR